VAGIEILLGSLAESQEPDGQRRPALDSDQRFGTDQFASRSEQRMTVIDAAHGDTIHLVDGPHQQLPFDAMHAAAIRPERIVADDQSQGNRIDPKD
jgi:hypothetical protein